METVPDASIASPPAFGQVYNVRADLIELNAARDTLSSWLRSNWRGPPSRCVDITLVFVELLTNAIEASLPDSSVHYFLHDDRREIVMRFLNSNAHRTPVELSSMPEPDAESGRGLALAARAADRLHIHWTEDSVEVSAHFRIAQ